MKTLNQPFCILMLVFCIVFSGCKTAKDTGKISLKKKSSHELINKLWENQLSFKWMSAKLSTKAVISNKRTDVSIKLRLRKDSAIWMSISPALGIEIARVLITKDTIRYLNRLEKSYYAGSFEYFRNHTPIDINFTILQSLLTGSAKGIMDKPKANDYSVFKASVQKGTYQLKKTNKKKDKKGRENKSHPDDFGNKIWLSPITYKLVKSELHTHKTNKKVISTYENFMDIDGQLVPQNATINMKGEETIKVTFDYYKIIINEPLNLPYTVPAKYSKNE